MTKKNHFEDLIAIILYYKNLSFKQNTKYKTSIYNNISTNVSKLMVEHI